MKYLADTLFLIVLFLLALMILRAILLVIEFRIMPLLRKRKGKQE